MSPLKSKVWLLMSCPGSRSISCLKRLRSSHLPRDPAAGVLNQDRTMGLALAPLLRPAPLPRTPFPVAKRASLLTCSQSSFWDLRNWIVLKWLCGGCFQAVCVSRYRQGLGKGSTGHYATLVPRSDPQYGVTGQEVLTGLQSQTSAVCPSPVFHCGVSSLVARSWPERLKYRTRAPSCVLCRITKKWVVVSSVGVVALSQVSVCCSF